MAVDFSTHHFPPPDFDRQPLWTNLQPKVYIKNGLDMNRKYKRNLSFHRIYFSKTYPTALSIQSTDDKAMS